MMFASPIFLWFLLLVVPWYVLGFAQLRALKEFAAQMVGGSVPLGQRAELSAPAAAWRQSLLRRTRALHCGAGFLVCAVLTLSEPSLGTRYVTHHIKDAELAWVLDVSNSMLLESDSGTRLQAAVQVADRVSAIHPVSRNSLTVFKGAALTLVPSTGVRQAFLDGLSWSGPELMTKAGSNLASALHLLAQRGGKGLSRLIIVLTDGHDTGQDTKQAAQRLAAAGDFLVFVGFGTAELQPVRTSNGRQVLDQYGQPVRLDQNRPGLDSLAAATQGAYLDTDKDGMLAVVAQISDLIRNHLQEPGAVALRASPVSRSAFFMILSVCFFALAVWHSRPARASSGGRQ